MSPKKRALKTTGKSAYARSGVDRQRADQLVDRIQALSEKAMSGFAGGRKLKSALKSTIGGYASLYELNPSQWIAATTDGVGTKLKLAFDLNRHDTIGIDLVAMSVNDLICVGARPLFFLDYFATGKLRSGVAEKVIQGILVGCKQSGCALVGGETAEMPDFYTDGEYDLGGFAVGVVSPRRVLPRPDVRPGDAMIGIASSGFHSNGFSLLRRGLAICEKKKIVTREQARVWSERWLTPTRIYVEPLMPLIESGQISGLAHITGSGILNIPRISDRVSYQYTLPAPASIFGCTLELLNEARLAPDPAELAQTFNLGVGMIVTCRSQDADRVLGSLQKSGEKASICGEVTKLKGKGPSVVTIDYRNAPELLGDGPRTGSMARSTEFQVQYL